jgi:nucleoside-diphosphate-sugar epimerase
MTSPEPKSCLITGARGYLGAELSLYLRKAGWRVIGAARHSSEAGTVPFSLDQGLEAGALKGVEALVHCAYDFGPGSWEEIYQRNVVGTRNLLEAAKDSGVKKIITISSISAYAGCRSLYGKAKLEIEEVTRAAGGAALRPGLIYGGSNRGMYGRLRKQVQAGRPVPLLVGSTCAQYLVRVEDLCGVIEAILSDKVPMPGEIWTVAHDRSWPLRELLETIALAEGKTIRFVPVPWQFVWFGLRCLESIGMKLGFKSDSVRSLAYQNPNPDFSGVEKSGLRVREFKPDRL